MGTLISKEAVVEECYSKLRIAVDFLIEHIKHGEQLGDLQQIVHFLCQVQQLQLAAAVPHRRKPLTSSPIPELSM